MNSANQYLSEIVNITKVQDHTAAGTSAVNSASVDMAGYTGVLFITSFGTAASGNTMEAAQSSDDSSFNDLTGTSVTSGSSDEDVWLDIKNPSDRYVRVEIARGTASTLESIWAIRYGARSGVSFSNVTSGTIIGERHNAAAEGTA